MSKHRHAALIIEDHQDSREALEMLIDASGYDVVAVRTGAEALARLRGGFACCLIVLDWWLPDMNGGEFVTQLRAEPSCADVPCVMCTGDSRVQDEVDSRALPVAGVYMKPLDAERLLELLERHCGRRPLPPTKEVT